MNKNRIYIIVGIVGVALLVGIIVLLRGGSGPGGRAAEGGGERKGGGIFDFFGGGGGGGGEGGGESPTNPPLSPRQVLQKQAAEYRKRAQFPPDSHPITRKFDPVKEDFTPSKMEAKNPTIKN